MALAARDIASRHAKTALAIPKLGTRPAVMVLLRSQPSIVFGLFLSFSRSLPLRLFLQQVRFRYAQNFRERVAHSFGFGAAGSSCNYPTAVWVLREYEIDRGDLLVK
jgi:hypothetical protein